MDKKFKLLIIDDNEEMLAALYNFFIKKNYDVVATPNSLHALKLIEAEKKGFDLV
jgi:DNA-binding response OmpR family regulator